MTAVPPPLADLRLRAEHLVRAHEYAELVQLAPILEREDPAWWPSLWAPCIAVAAEVLGDNGWPLLQNAVDLGFRQPELFRVADTFRHHAAWPALQQRMRAPAPPPEYTLLEWPTVTYGPPLVLDTVPAHRLARLRAQLPPVGPSAWQTALTLLTWVSTRWEHANDHFDTPDAVALLAAVDEGRRFACVEYSIVLSQALNAVGIPARRLSLRMIDSHVGMARGHVVSEAWVDDIGGWVVLDGQNGAWWGEEGQPLGFLELQSRRRAGSPPAPMHCTGREADNVDLWWAYFHDATTTGMAWSRPFVPIFQHGPLPVDLLAAPTANVYPDLSELATGLTCMGDEVGVMLTPAHPYATGVRIGQRQMSLGEALPLPQAFDGQPHTQASTVTPFGVLRPHPLRCS